MTIWNSRKINPVNMNGYGDLQGFLPTKNNLSGNMSYGELQELAKKRLLEDRIKLSGTNYSPYPGKTVSPMSALTQRAEALEERRSKKGMPYGKSLDILANKESEGITQPDLQLLLNTLSDKHRNFNRDITGRRLDKQFGAAFDPYRNKYDNRFQKDTRLRLDDTAVDLDSLNNEVKNLEKSNRYRTAFSALTNSSLSKQDRHNKLTGNLRDLGTQKHGINNMNLTAEQARFNAERREPYERLANLQRAVGGINMEEEHPDVLQHNASQLGKALTAYDMKTPTYQGKLAEPINADLATSYSLLEDISPSYQDKNYAARKQLRKSIVNDPNTIGKFIQTKLPGNLDPKFALLDQEAKQKAKADMTALNAKYIKQGMYGGQSHMQDASNRMRELNNAAFGANSKTMKNELTAGVNNAHNENISNIRRLGQYDQLANSEFENVVGDIRRTNTSGLEKWKNEQGKNEQLYKAYQNEKGYQQPRMLDGKFREGVGYGSEEASNYLKGMGIDLSEISDLKGRYDNLEKELMSNRAEIKNRNDYDTQQQKIKGKEDMNRRLLDATRESDDLTNWWNTGGSKGGDANWKRVEAARAKLATIENEVRASPYLSELWGNMVRESSARRGGYNRDWDENQKRIAEGERLKAESIALANKPSAPISKPKVWGKIAHFPYGNGHLYGAQADGWTYGWI